MKLNTTNLIILIIGILLLLSAWSHKPFLEVAKGMVKDGKITRTVSAPGAPTSDPIGSAPTLQDATEAGRKAREAAEKALTDAGQRQLENPVPVAPYWN